MELLKLFEGKALHRALSASGHEVGLRTVQRWIAGDSTPKPQDVAAILRLLNGVDAKEAALPAWAEQLDQKFDLLLQGLGVAPGKDRDQSGSG